MPGDRPYLIHTEEVTGSIPVSPTRSEAVRDSRAAFFDLGTATGAAVMAGRPGSARGAAEHLVWLRKAPRCRPAWSPRSDCAEGSALPLSDSRSAPPGETRRCAGRRGRGCSGQRLWSSVVRVPGEV